MTKATKITPLMKQYNDIKSKYPNTILLFRVGDFYETFGEDAILASKVLGIVLTKRGAGSTSETELAGFPHHSIENYLPKLVKTTEVEERKQDLSILLFDIDQNLEEKILNEQFIL